MTNLGPAQDSQFVFDDNGNLLQQLGAASSPSRILRQPQDEVVEPGETASFSVVVSNTQGLSYQWRFNGSDISGATTDALLITNVNAASAGQYTVVLTNSAGNATSAPARLWIDSDGDGLPDSWELAHFGNLAQTAAGDSDGDGVSNLDEFLEGTNPADGTSVRFRLVVLSDGGSVTVNPSRFSFTNGETVTLTATAFAPFYFRGWTGDLRTTNNPLTITMTNNVTVFAHLSAYDITWSSPAGGDWEVATNWTPSFVPGPNDNVFISSTVEVTLNSVTECASLTLGNATSAPNLTGTGTLTLRRNSCWTGGGMTGGGRTIVASGVTLVLSNAAPVTLGRTLENGGTILWGGAAINMAAGVLTNCPGALFHVQNNAPFNLFGLPNRFDNAGTFRKTSSGATLLAAGIPFNNNAVVDLRNGMIVANGGFNSSSNALLSFRLGGTNAGSGYAQLQLALAIALGGSLSVDLVNGFFPTPNDSFTVIAAGMRTGSFKAFSYPSNQVTMMLSNTPTGVIVRVASVAPLRPTLLLPQIVEPDLELTWTTIPKVGYRVEFNPDLNATNWRSLAGDVISISNTASKRAPFTASNGFYRVRVLP